MLNRITRSLLTDRVTIMVVPRANQGVRSYRIPVGAIYGVLAIFMGSLFASGHSVLRASELSRQKHEVARLLGENQSLNVELAQVQTRVDGLKTELAQLTDFEEQIRVVADLDPTDDDVMMVGIGGPEVGARRDLIAWNESAGEVADEALASRRSVETLTRQARLLRESFDEVLTNLEDRKDELSRTPSILPVENGWLTDRYGYRTDPFTGKRSMHYGLDVSARNGEPILAAADGKVIYAGKKGAYGYTVEIDHGNGITTRYSHASKLFVARGQSLKRGQVIAAVGSTGRSTSPHLHYEVRDDNRCVDPLRFIIPTERARRS